MYTLKEKSVTLIFRALFYIAAVILIAVPVRESAAKKHEIPDFADAEFNDSLNINNQYMPLNVGDVYVYRSETEDGIEEDTVEVTSGSEMIRGMDCRAVSDIVTLTNDVLDHQQTEVTTDWYAQDDDGNVWYCGEDTTEYFFDDEGNPDGSSVEGSWRANEPGAEPGVVILANPVSGDRYMQEYLEDVAEDMALVMRLNAKVSIDFGDFDNCLLTKEWSPLEKGAIEHKYYAPGIGLVYNTDLSGGKTVKVELVDYTPAP